MKCLGFSLGLPWLLSRWVLVVVGFGGVFRSVGFWLGSWVRIVKSTKRNNVKVA